MSEPQFPLDDDFESFDLTSMHVADGAGFQQGARLLRVHPRSKCEGRDIPCCIHEPSAHHMREWPMNWRGDRRIMERICHHGIGHIDPDDAAYRKTVYPPYPGPEVDEMIRNQLPAGVWIQWFDDGVHGCDLCCVAGNIAVE